LGEKSMYQACELEPEYPVSRQPGGDVVNLRLDGILDKTGRIPAGGEALCFEAAKCGDRP
jgi:hypothetical protein